MNKENWIDDVINTGEYLNKVLPSHELIKRLAVVPEKSAFPVFRSVRPHQMWLAAAGVALLIGFNLFTFLLYQSSVQESTSAQTYTEYFDHLKQPQI